MRKLSIGVTLVALIHSALSAQTVATDILGVWTLERPSGPLAPFAVQTRIDVTQVEFVATPQGFEITRWIGPTVISGAYELSGIETDNAGLHRQRRRSIARWDGVTFIVRERETVTQPAGEAQVEVTERWTPQPNATLLLDVASTIGNSTVNRIFTFVRAR